MTSETGTVIRDGDQAVCTLAPGTVITGWYYTVYGLHLHFAEGNPILIRSDLSVEILSDFQEGHA